LGQDKQYGARRCRGGIKEELDLPEECEEQEALLKVRKSEEVEWKSGGGDGTKAVYKRQVRADGRRGEGEGTELNGAILAMLVIQGRLSQHACANKNGKKRNVDELKRTPTTRRGFWTVKETRKALRPLRSLVVRDVEKPSFPTVFQDPTLGLVCERG
jgi:hypothetical protein